MVAVTSAQPYEYTKQQFSMNLFRFKSSHKKIENMNDSFRVYKDAAILNSALEFLINLVWTEMPSFRYVLNVH